MDQVLLPQTIFIFRANKSVGPGQSGIYLGAHAYEASRHGILQVVLAKRIPVTLNNPDDNPEYPKRASEYLNDKYLNEKALILRVA